MRKRPIRIQFLLPAVVAAVGLVLAQASVAPAGTRTHTYKPPFKQGDQGGDSSNYVYTDPSSGQVMVLRAYPVFNPFTCGGSRGGWATLRLPLEVQQGIASVEVDYDNAVVDPYSFLTVTVKKGDRFLGSKDIRGPVTGSGKVVVPLQFGKAKKGATIVIDFGLEVPSGCPNVQAAMAEFTTVVLHDA
jgi:hypothetical protein